MEAFHNYLGTSEGSILNAHWSDCFGILIYLSSYGRRLLRSGRPIQNILSNEELLIVLRRHLNLDKDQKAAAIDCLVTSGVRNHISQAEYFSTRRYII